MSGLESVMPAISRREAATVEAARTFAREVIEPNAVVWDEAGRVPAEAFREAAGRGLCGLTVPESLGGRGLAMPAMALAVEAFASACMASAFAFVVHNNLARSLSRNATAAQQSRWLPPLIGGERIGAFLLTEPQGGSDAAAITTAARRDGGGWRLDGEKAWVSNGASADLLSVYAQTDPSEGWRGIACFIVEADAPGAIREPAYRLLGGHALGAGGFRFEGCRVDADDVLLGPGEGFKAAMAGIDFARVNVAAMCCGMLGRSLDTALAFAAGRRAFGGRAALAPGSPVAAGRRRDGPRSGAAADRACRRGPGRRRGRPYPRRRAREEVHDPGGARPHRRLHAGDGGAGPADRASACPPSRLREDGSISRRDDGDPERRDRPGSRAWALGGSPRQPRLAFKVSDQSKVRPRMPECGCP